MKIFNIVENEDGPVNWENRKIQGTEEEYNRAVKQEASARHQRYVFMDKAMQYKDVVVTAWTPEKFSVPVSHAIKFNYNWWGIATDTPNGDEIWKALKFYVDRYTRAEKMMGRYQRLVSKLKKKLKSETLNNLKSKDPYVRIDSADVPRKIYYAPTKYFDNPYWQREGVVKRYAGPVGHFPDFKTAEHNVLFELEKTLRKFGLPGMTKMFGCVFKENRGHHGVVTKNRFVVFGADGRLIWKYSNGNHIYVDGKKVPITSVINATVGAKSANSKTEANQRELLEPLKTPK